MSATMLFEGRVHVRPLLVTDQPATRAEVQARLLTPGGEFVVLADGVNAIRHLGYVELVEGRVRGNHYHKLRHESFYVIAGEVDLHVQELNSSERAVILLRTGDMALIAPGIAHTFLPRKNGQALEFAPEPFDGADVFRHVLI